MRILAVIPACGGSATLPNRNIRVLHGKPMIYYVINNAIKSKYITDVLVTTNSAEIIGIAKHMGVMTRHRDEALCNWHTSVEQAVYDVFNELDISDYDYVVTMQSISPTLKSSTLDKAFEKLFKEKLDSLISVRNQAQFYWEKTASGLRPIQPVRMNRHQLPPFYVETGAFCITKAEFVRANSRFGERVGVFELSGDEAIDVNSFGDLKQAECAMARSSTAIYVNGNDTIGLGHISRVIQVADELFTKPDIYYDRNQTNPSVFSHNTYDCIPVDGAQGFCDAVKVGRYDIVINDVLNTSLGYMQNLRAAAPHSRIVNFEDEGEGAVMADAIINALYENSSDSKVYTGSRYYILPKLFLIYEPITIRDKVSTVLVSFGGADPQGYTELVLELAKSPEYKDIQFYFILGSAKKNAQLIMDSSYSENIHIMHNINNMPEMMSLSDVAVTSRGRTCFELAALGIPSLSIAQHEREEKHGFACLDNGFSCLNTSPDKDVLSDALRKLVFSSREARESCQHRMLKHNLRSGRKNVRDLINNLQEEKI